MSRVFVSIAAAAIAVAFAFSAQAEEEKDVPKALDFKVKSLEDKEVDLKQYEGKVVLIVNVASECGLTPQYKELQALHEKYADDGLAILAFPCNQFGKQEPGSSQEIREFCTTKYGVKFDMFSKVDVNGEKAAPLYKYLTALDTQPKGAGDISWNFEKFLLDREGNVIARYEPQTEPTDEAVVTTIEKELKQDNNEDK